MGREIRIIENSISLSEIAAIAREGFFGEYVKVVVDIEKGIMAIGGALHADEEAVMLQNGSLQENLWGINLYVERAEGEWIEFDSMINLRAWQGNRSRSVEDPAVQQKIRAVVGKLVTR